jgi:hypothetical protein
MTPILRHLSVTTVVLPAHCQIFCPDTAHIILTEAVPLCHAGTKGEV